jgi:hypothetical protein
MKLRKFSFNEEGNIAFSLEYDKKSKVAISGVRPMPDADEIFREMQTIFPKFMSADNGEMLIGFQIRPAKKNEENGQPKISFSYTNGQNNLLVYNSTELVSIVKLDQAQVDTYEGLIDAELHVDGERVELPSISPRLYYFHKLCELAAGLEKDLCHGLDSYICEAAKQVEPELFS